MNIYDYIGVNASTGVPIATQLSQQLTWLITGGQIAEGEKLPPVRALATRLGIHMHTVRAAYHQLKADGLVTVTPGRGTIVQPVDVQALSSALPSVRTFTIGVIIPGYNPIYNSLLSGIEDAAQDTGALLFICTAHESPIVATQYVTQLVARNVDGIIIASMPIIEAQPQSGALPIVYADLPDAPAPAVVFEMEEAGFAATRHLIEHGHSRIGLISPPLDWVSPPHVLAGYRRALDAAGQPFAPELIAHVDLYTEEQGFAGTAQLLDLPAPPTAILANDDLLAIGAMSAIRASGLRVGTDIAVVGIDNLNVGMYSHPPLTTVALPAAEMGRQAMHMLRTMIAGDAPEPRERRLPVELVIRESCGCP